MKMNTDNKIALLIDGDNAQPRFISSVLTEAERLGVVIVKRIYGDWTTDQLLSWKHKLMQHSIKPVQKFAVGKGKNSTDTAIIIDAMDLLHSKKVNGFCIMSSDSDYTGLAQRIREEGMFVMGVGESRKTNTVFVKS
ncbi:MAG: NYN domain-containing protein, partial [Chitinophagaceae bacterium]|nr:NYN domain-containing protein [Chitinophagaceae bacterium]